MTPRGGVTATPSANPDGVKAMKIDRDAYAMGATAGNQISLDRQIGGLDRTARIV